MDGVDFATLPGTGPRVRRDDTLEPWLPREAPLAMPAQSLRQSPPAPTRLATSPRWLPLRRAGFIGSIMTMTGAAGWTTFRALAIDTLGPLDIAILAVFVCLFGWTASSFVTALAGLWAGASGQADPLGIGQDHSSSRLSSRTAILAPIFSEETHLVFGRLQAIWESVMAAGDGGSFDLFVLSDTSDPSHAIAEERAFEGLRQRTGRPGQLFYRRRLDNLGRKAGNIADWVRRFGRRYDFMVVLDADSLMEGETLMRLAAAMERHPGVGLIQTTPAITNRLSLFGRLHQFASQVYGPMMAHGLAWWSGSEANYWGHNAIIRVRAFAAHAGLPCLRGRKPFGGHILSHDFVEAALIRRAGWAVHMAPQLGGTYEECPPTLAGFLVRDRRWCQGNLQHLRIITARGLHWVSRLHLLNGALTYLTAPLWLALLGMSVLLPLDPQLGIAPSRGVQPSSAAHDLVAATWVCGISFAFLVAPKLIAWTVMIADPSIRRRQGGAAPAAASLFLEILTSSLIAPVVMLSQSGMIADLLSGRDSGWRPQRRSEGSLGLVESCRSHLWHTAVGVGLGAAALAASPTALLWISPAILGLVLSVPLASAIARRDLGQAARRLGLLLTPDEISPPAVGLRASALAGEYLRADPPAHKAHVLPRPLIGERRSFDPRPSALGSVLGALANVAPAHGSPDEGALAHSAPGSAPVLQ